MSKNTWKTAPKTTRYPIGTVLTADSAAPEPGTVIASPDGTKMWLTDRAIMTWPTKPVWYPATVVEVPNPAFPVR
jgi:hypothetical protein